MQINPEIVKQQVADLLVAHPELAEDEEALLLSLASETDGVELLERLVRRIQSAKAMANGLEGYISELRGRVEMFDRRAEALRSLVFKIMQAAEIQKMPLESATLTIRAGTPKVIITDEKSIPERYWRVHREPNKVEIAAAFKSNLPVPGCLLNNPEPALSIRTK